MKPYLSLLRPAEWIKNIFVFAALGFGNRMGDREAVGLSLAAFVAFCLASSAGYIFNDIFDRERDRLHPTKKHRPLTSGAVSLPAAGVVIALLGFGVVVICATALAGQPRFWWSVGAYLLLTAAYSVVLKYRMILDVIVIAILFVLRALGGAVAIDVPVSPWLLVCTFMLCLFIGFGKRRCELVTLGNSDALRGHRPTLVRYTPDLLTHLLSTSGGIAIMTFVLYTLDTSWKSPLQQRRHNLVFTLPLVVYGIYRYAMLIELGKGSGPTDLLIKDLPFLMAIVLWVMCVIVILYAGSWMGTLVPMG